MFEFFILLSSLGLDLTDVFDRFKWDCVFRLGFDFIIDVGIILVINVNLFGRVIVIAKTIFVEDEKARL